MAQAGLNDQLDATLRARLQRIKLLISDIDGTLVHRDKTIGNLTLDAIARLKQAGIGFTLVSARPPKGMQRVVEAAGVHQPTCAFNGGTLVDVDGRIIETHYLRPDVATEAIAMGYKANAEVYVFADGEWFLKDMSGPYVPVEQHTLGYAGVLVASFDDVIERIEKIVIASGDEPVLAKLEQTTAEAFQGRASASRSQTYYLDITDIKANKGNAVDAMARHMSLSHDEIAVIGDGSNDVPMFLKAGISIAMGQSTDGVKEHATFVTASNDDDGVARAIETFLLPGR